MILVRTTMTLAVVALVLSVAMTAPATHQENLKSEYLDYIGTNLIVSGPFIGTFPLIPPSGGCDQPGNNGVVFCDTLNPLHPNGTAKENFTLPDRVHIDVRDDLGPRVGFMWEFRSASGGLLQRGFACGSVNTWVPHEDVGGDSNNKTWFPNATELRVIPDILAAAIERPSVTTVPSIPLGVADTINDLAPDNVTVPGDVPEVGNTTVPVPTIPNATPEVSVGHPFVCGSPTVASGTVSVDWRYNAPVFDF